MTVSIVVAACSSEQQPVAPHDAVERVKLYRGMYASTGNPDYAEEVLKALRSDDREAVFEALFSLQQLAPKWRDQLGNSAIKAIQPLLKEEDAFLLHSATAAVISYGEFALPLVDDLCAIMRRDASGAASFAADAIGEIGEPANHAQGDLVDALSASSLTKHSAVRALDRIGNLSQSNVERLQILIQAPRDDWTYQIDLAKVLLRNDPGNKAATEELVLAFQQPTAKLWVLDAIENLKLAGEPWANDLLKAALRDETDGIVRAVAAKLVKERDLELPQRSKP